MIVEIDRLGTNGEGIFIVPEGEQKGKICFVDFALPGELVDVEIVKSKSNFCVAKLNKIIKYSENREIPICPFFAHCGGCDIQHMKKNFQIDFKKNKVIKTLSKYLNNLDNIKFIRLNDLYYRNKMVFPFCNKNGQACLGMYCKNSHEFVDINYCYLTSENINKILKLSKDFFSKNKFDAFDEKLNKGILKYLVVKEYNNQFLVSIVCTKLIDVKDFYKILNSEFPEIGLSLIISNSNDEILTGEYIHLYGLKQLSIEEFGINYNVNILGFLQINNAIKIELYNNVLNEISYNDVVIDAYSGAGLLTAIIAKKAKNVFGIEINSSASKSAKELAKINNLKNAKFINSDVKDVLIDYLQKYKSSVLILDPPRSGCDKKLLNKLIETKNISFLPKKIIYISCNLMTLVRDLEILNKYYDLQNVHALDMFPQTKHVECVSFLNLK